MTTETPTAQTELVDDTPKELQVIVQQESLQPASAQSLQATFAPYWRQARGVLETSKSIQVTDASQKLEMKMARACRLELKAIRVASDKARKEVKDEYVRTGRAIDHYHGVLVHLVETEEKRLQAQEDFVEQQEAQRKAALKADREKVLATIQVDPALYNLADMGEETFQQLVEGTKLARAAEAERRRKEEAERIEREAKAAAEQERIRQENERLKKEAADKAAAEKLERERRHDLHCTRMAILGAEELLTVREVQDADFAEIYAKQTEEEFSSIRDHFRARKVEQKRLADERAEAQRKLKEAEEKAAAEKARVDAERKAAEEKAKAERDALAKKHAEEQRIAAAKAKEQREAAEKRAAEQQAAREKLEKEIAEKKAADDKRKADEAEAARKAATAPDKEKIVLLAKRLDVEIPDMATQAGKDLIERFMVRQAELIAWLREEYKKL